MFGVGWILGPIREFWAVPHFGRVAATLSEAVIMLIAMVVAARWVIRRFAVPQTATTGKGIAGILIDRPRRLEDRPDRDRLVLRFEKYRKAA
jgi:hypothetical protein